MFVLFFIDRYLQARVDGFNGLYVVPRAENKNLSRLACLFVRRQVLHACVDGSEEDSIQDICTSFSLVSAPKVKVDGAQSTVPYFGAVPEASLWFFKYHEWLFRGRRAKKISSVLCLLHYSESGMGHDVSLR